MFCNASKYRYTVQYTDMKTEILRTYLSSYLLECVFFRLVMASFLIALCSLSDVDDEEFVAAVEDCDAVATMVPRLEVTLLLDKKSLTE